MLGKLHQNSSETIDLVGGAEEVAYRVCIDFLFLPFFGKKNHLEQL